jgi:amino acid transporter
MSRSAVEMKKELGFLQGLAITVGGIVGVGMLIIPGMAAGVAGPASLLAWGLTGFLCLFMASSFAQLASMFEETGGPYIYVLKGFGKRIGFLAGWSGLLGAWIALSVLTLLIPQYLAPILSLSKLQQTCVSLSIVSVLSLINIRGIRQGAVVQLLLFSGLLLTLLFFTGGGALNFNIQHFTPFMPYGWRSVGKAMGLAMWAFLGWEYALMPAAEYKNPKRDLPLIIMVGTLLIIVLYCGVAASCLGSVPWQELAKTTTPLVLASSRWGGSCVIAVGSVVIMSGCLNAGLLSSGRLLYSMAKNEALPQPLASLHPQYCTPYTALLVQWGVMSFLVVLKQVELFVYISNVLFLTTYLLSFVALIPLKKKVTLLPVISSIMCSFLILQLGFQNIFQAFLILGFGGFIFELRLRLLKMKNRKR